MFWLISKESTAGERLSPTLWDTTTKLHRSVHNKGGQGFISLMYNVNLFQNVTDQHYPFTFSTICWNLVKRAKGILSLLRVTDKRELLHCFAGMCGEEFKLSDVRSLRVWTEYPIYFFLHFYINTCSPLISFKADWS